MICRELLRQATYPIEAGHWHAVRIGRRGTSPSRSLLPVGRSESLGGRTATEPIAAH